MMKVYTKFQKIAPATQRVERKHFTHTARRNSLFSTPQPHRSRNFSTQIVTSTPRIKSDYRNNITAALYLPVPRYVLERNEKNPEELIDISKNLIREHAARRVDLYFYTLIAYYKSGKLPERGHTVLQHGRGRNSSDMNITQGCHSSFFGGFVDNPGEPKSILSDTHFLDSLNMTVELPFFVNKLDDELEVPCECRKKGIDILHRVSLGELNPIQGLGEFLRMMESTFDYLRKNADLPARRYSANSIEPPYNLTPSLKRYLIDLEKVGTLKNKWSHETKSVQEEYVELLLRLTPEEKLLAKTSKEIKDKIYFKKIDELQKEILKHNETKVPAIIPADKNVDPSPAKRKF